MNTFVALLLAVTVWAQPQNDLIQNETILVDVKACVEIAGQLSLAPHFNSVILDDLADQKPQLILLGEGHYEHYFWKLPQIYDMFKKVNPDINCLFTEMSQDVTEQEMLEVRQGIANRVFYSPFRLGFGPIYNHVIAQGDHVIAVDAPVDVMRDDELRQDDVKWLTVRDDYMIAKIKESFASGKCKAAIYNVGAYHLSQEAGNPYVSLGVKLKTEMKENVAVVSQLYQYFGDYRCDLWDGFWSYFNSFFAPVSAIPENVQLYTARSITDYVLFLPPAMNTASLLFKTPAKPESEFRPMSIPRRASEDILR